MIFSGIVPVNELELRYNPTSDLSSPIPLGIEPPRALEYAVSILNDVNDPILDGIGPLNEFSCKYSI